MSRGKSESSWLPLKSHSSRSCLTTKPRNWLCSVLIRQCFIRITVKVFVMSNQFAFPHLPTLLDPLSKGQGLGQHFSNNDSPHTLIQPSKAIFSFISVIQKEQLRLSVSCLYALVKVTSIAVETKSMEKEGIVRGTLLNNCKRIPTGIQTLLYRT